MVVLTTDKDHGTICDAQAFEKRQYVRDCHHRTPPHFPIPLNDDYFGYPGGIERFPDMYSRVILELNYALKMPEIGCFGAYDKSSTSKENGKKINLLY